MTKHSPSTEPMKMIMNPKTGKMVQAGGQLGKKLIRNYNADKIYNPLTGKQVLTGGSVGKKVLGLYKEGGTNSQTPPQPPAQPQTTAQNASTFACNETQKMNVYLLFRSMTREEKITNEKARSKSISTENITPGECSSKGLISFNTCKTGTIGKREWMPRITNGLTKIFPTTDLNKLMKNDTFWEELQRCYKEGEKQYAGFIKKHTYTFKIDRNLLQNSQSPTSESETYKFNVINSENTIVGTGTVVIITGTRNLSMYKGDTIDVYKRKFTIDPSSITDIQLNNTYDSKIESHDTQTKFTDHTITTINEADFEKGLNTTNAANTNTVQSTSCQRLDITKLKKYTEQLEELYTDKGLALKCVDTKTLNKTNSGKIISNINTQINSVIDQINELDEKNEYTHEIHRIIDKLVEKIISQSSNTQQNPHSGGKKKIKKNKDKKCRSN
jgi:hypothetical protein